MTDLRVFQSLWAMQPYDDMGTAFDKVRDAGFDGMAIDLGASDVATAMTTLPHFERTGLTPLIVAFPKSVPALRETLVMARDFGAPFVVVIGQVFPLTVEGAIPIIRRWMDMADEEGVPIQFETHRNCITNDLFAMLTLMDAIPDMPVCADLSHYVVDREFWYPLSDFDRALIDRVLARASSFQGRVASRQQIQLQLDFPQHRKWVDLFEGWWEDGFRHWHRRHPGESPVFLCELGPPEYAMTDASGAEMSDRWAEALTLRDTARRLWEKVRAEA
jgi:hypothetical protein